MLYFLKAVFKGLMSRPRLNAATKGPESSLPRHVLDRQGSIFFANCRSWKQLTAKRTAALIVGICVAWSAPTAAGNMAHLAFIQIMDLNLRAGPGTQWRILRTLEKGAAVNVLEQGQQWLKVEYEGRSGYIRNKPGYVRLVAYTPQTDDANPDPASDVQSIKRQAAQLSAEIEKSKAEVTHFNQEEAKVLEALQGTEQALYRARRDVKAARTQLTELELQIETATKTYQALLAQVVRREAFAAKRLRALYKLYALGSWTVLASAQSATDLMVRKKALERILAYDQSQLAALAQDKGRLLSALMHLGQQREQKASLEREWQKHIAAMSTRQSAREQLLCRIRDRKSLALAAIRAMQQATRQLDAAIGKLEARQPGTNEGPHMAGRHEFSQLKGLLNLPVKGKIIFLYGPYRSTRYHVVNFYSGINIQADRGEPVHAISEGVTLFSNWFKGYGNMVIIDHGNHYYTVYAHLEEIFKSPGDSVQAGEVIATVGDTGSLSGPGLHFEVRHHGKPLDPMLWIRVAKKESSDNG
jgi:septal ring factor EnvC (AmiA/AmiB activator)